MSAGVTGSVNTGAALTAPVALALGFAVPLAPASEDVPPPPRVAAYTVQDNGIEQPLTAGPADADRGRRIVIDPARGNCLICHTVPDAPGERFQGDIGPPLAGVGTRASAAELRLRLVDGTRLNPDTVMPAYHRVRGLTRVAQAWRDRPVLSAREIEDVVAYLQTLTAAGSR